MRGCYPDDSDERLPPHPTVAQLVAALQRIKDQGAEVWINDGHPTSIWTAGVGQTDGYGQPDCFIEVNEAEVTHG